jgi:GR25 family glycosyltransferase involved in LPS biosynthesis
MVDPYVITLDVNTDRFERFMKLNDHLTCNVFIGTDGSRLSYLDGVNRGFLTQECADSGMVSKGALGCAISHWTLWWKAVYEKRSLLILEDDVVTHPDIQAWIDKLHIDLNIADKVDILYLGLNTDSIIEAISPEGVHQISMFGERYPDYESISERLSLTRTSNVRLWRMLKGFGNCCYLVTPRGAAKLVESVLPLRLEGVPVPLLSGNMPGTGVDRRMNALFESIEAYVGIPFLAWTPNTESATRASSALA